MEFWSCEVCEFWSLGVLSLGVFEFRNVDFGNFIVLEFGVLGMCECWNFGFGNLEFWCFDFGNLEFQNFEVLEFWSFGILNFGVVKFGNFGVLKF